MSTADRVSTPSAPDAGATITLKEAALEFLAQPRIAVVGVSEKGITSVRLTVEQHGGHASTPPKTTATVRLARAITRVNAKPFPARLSETTLRMVETLGAHATGPLRAVFVRARRLQPLLREMKNNLRTKRYA